MLNSDYYRTTPAVRLQYAAQYLLLAGTLASMAFEAHQRLGGQ